MSPVPTHTYRLARLPEDQPILAEARAKSFHEEAAHRNAQLEQERLDRQAEHAVRRAEAAEYRRLVEAMDDGEDAS